MLEGERFESFLMILIAWCHKTIGVDFKVRIYHDWIKCLIKTVTDTFLTFLKILN